MPRDRDGSFEPQIARATGFSGQLSACLFGNRLGESPLPVVRRMQIDQRGPAARVAHAFHQLAEGGAGLGQQIVLDTCSVKILLPGISDVRTLEASASLCDFCCRSEGSHGSATYRGTVEKSCAWCDSRSCRLSPLWLGR